MRVRRMGKSYAHPLIVLVALPNQLDRSRFAIAAGRSVGKSVQRNRAKRYLRESLRPLLASIVPGWDVILLARRPILSANLPECRAALLSLLQRAGLIYEPQEGNVPTESRVSE